MQTATVSVCQSLPRPTSDNSVGTASRRWNFHKVARSLAIIVLVDIRCQIVSHEEMLKIFLRVEFIYFIKYSATKTSWLLKSIYEEIFYYISLILSKIKIAWTYILHETMDNMSTRYVNQRPLHLNYVDSILKTTFRRPKCKLQPLPSTSCATESWTLFHASGHPNRNSV